MKCLWILFFFISVSARAQESHLASEPLKLPAGRDVGVYTDGNMDDYTRCMYIDHGTNCSSIDYHKIDAKSKIILLNAANQPIPSNCDSSSQDCKPVQRDMDQSGENNFYKVQVISNGQKVIGYVDISDVSGKVKPKICPEPSKNNVNKDLPQVATRAQEDATNDNQSLIDSIKNQISINTGKCLVDDGLKKEFELDKKKNDQDDVSWNSAKYYKSKIKSDSYFKNSTTVTDPNTHKPVTVTPDQKEQIDLMARTLYAEMAKVKCSIVPGPIYLKAVARITLNRIDVIGDTKSKTTPGTCSFNMRDRKSNEILNPGISEKDNPLTQLIFTQSQYSGWNKDLYDYRYRTKSEIALCQREKKQNKKINCNGKVPIPVFNTSGLEQSLCPPKDKSDQEKKIWDSIMNVAIEAVMQPDILRGETKSLEGKFYYTTTPDNVDAVKHPTIFDDLLPISAPHGGGAFPLTVDGKPVSNPHCMNFYDTEACDPKGPH